MLSSATLQIIALTTMLIDHIGMCFFGDLLFLRIVGRIAMPVFVFGLVEGFIHTHNRRDYFLRLLFFACVSQVPFTLLRLQLNYPVDLNILFAFVASFMALYGIEKKDWRLVLVPIAVVLILLVEYSLTTLILVLGFYFMRTKLKPGNVSYTFALFMTLLVANIYFVVTFGSPLQIFGVLAAVPILLYGGKKGRRLPRYFAYIFYPAHLLILFAIKALFLH